MIGNIRTICSGSGDTPRWCRLVRWFMTPEDTSPGAGLRNICAMESAAAIHAEREKGIIWAGLSVAVAVLVSLL